MKRFSCWVLVGLLVTTPALAVPSVQVTRTAGTYPDHPFSGEFTLLPNDELRALTGEGVSFQSFCLEMDESADIGGIYQAVVNNEAILGGELREGELPGPQGGDLLSPETAFLYSQFRAGTLIGYDFTIGPGRESSARALQAAIWYLEGEDAAMSAMAWDFVDLAEDADWETIGNVRVLNLWGMSPTDKHYYQDMLTLTVPAPGALLLGGLGTCIIGWLRRRRAL